MGDFPDEKFLLQNTLGLIRAHYGNSLHVQSGEPCLTYASFNTSNSHCGLSGSLYTRWVRGTSRLTESERNEYLGCWRKGYCITPVYLILRLFLAFFRRLSFLNGSNNDWAEFLCTQPTVHGHGRWLTQACANGFGRPFDPRCGWKADSRQMTHAYNTQTVENTGLA